MLYDTICSLMATIPYPPQQSGAGAMRRDQASDLLTVKEAASLLKVSPVTIKRYLKSGLLRAFHIGPRAIRIRREDLEKLLTPAGTEEVPMKQERVQISPPSPEEVA